MTQTRCSCVLLATCLALFAAAPARTDDAPAIPDPAPAPTAWTSPLQPGARALLFGIGSNFDLQTFGGAAISYKIQRSASSAWRFGLTLNASTRDEDASSFSQLSDTLSSSGTQQGSNDFESIDVGAAYLRYADPVERVSFYFGGGPSVGWRRDRQDITLRNQLSDGTPATVTSASDTRDSFSVGLGGTIGVEWFCTKRISLIGEYLCDVSYYWDSGESTYQFSALTSSRRSFEAEGFRFLSQGVRAGVSAYFR